MSAVRRYIDGPWYFVTAFGGAWLSDHGWRVGPWIVLVAVVVLAIGVWDRDFRKKPL